MTRIRILIKSLLILSLVYGCARDEILEGKYARPDWLTGKIYDQMLEQPDLSTFAKCVELTGYDKVINVSGIYSVFAPSNEAFNAYFSLNPNYSSVEDIPIEELTKIVKYHIVQNSYSKTQLTSLDVYGWIDTLDIANDKPRGFKRLTLLLDDNQKFGVSSAGTGRNLRAIIVDTLKSKFNRMVAADSRKYAPIFYKEYLDIYDLEKKDYEFYFDRSFDSPDLYFAGAKVISDEIFAENGFIYIVDKVVEPLKTAYQILADQGGTNQYTDYLDVVNVFPNFRYDEGKTFDQPGAREGLAVDSLFNLTYPELIFNIKNEETTPPEGTFGIPQNSAPIRYHHGLMAPTNEAFQTFENEYLKIPDGWGSINNAPIHIKRIIAKTYMANRAIYPTDFENGFLNGEKDRIILDPSTIIEKQFGSNASFIGLNKALVPRAFSSVTGPVYLQRDYRKVMFAIEKAGLLPALKRENENYAFFIESDINTEQDSSFFYDELSNRFAAVQTLIPGEEFLVVLIGVDDLRNLILNHIATRTPSGIARKEFIPNLAGNFLIFDNETGEVSGTAQTTRGYLGLNSAKNFPERINFESDNGNTYEIENWFSFTAPSVYSLISSNYPEFHKLLVKAGLAQVKQFRYTFISNNEFYTVFAPSDSVIINSDLNQLPVNELKNLLLLHFVKGELIFTDGSKSPNYYETVRIDEKSTPFNVIYTPLYLDPDFDIITIKAADGENDIEVVESGKTNKLAGVQTSVQGAAFPTIYNNMVVHEIDKILRVEELDTN